MSVTFTQALTAVLTNTTGKLLSALGVGFVGYTGLDAIQQRFANMIEGQLDSLPAAAVQIFYLAGGGVVLNYIFGAVAFAFTLKGASKLTAMLRD